MERMRYLNKLMFVFALILFVAISRVNAEVVNNTDSPQDVRLYLQSTENTTPDEKTDASEDEKRIWNVIFSTHELVWNVNQNVDGGAYYYVWNAETGKYSRVIARNSGAVTTTLADNEASKTIDITNKSNFDITPSITIPNQNITGLFSATYNSGSIAWNVTKSATVTIDSNVLENITELIPDNLTSTTVENENVYVAGNVTISLDSGPIYASNYNQP